MHRRVPRPSRLRRNGGRRSRPARASRSPTSTHPPTSPVCDEERDLGRPGRVPVHPWRPADDVPGRLWTMRQYAGFATAAETNRPLPVPARAGPDRPVGRVRPADPDGLRLRRAAGGGRGGPRGRARSARSPTWRPCSKASRSTTVSTSMTINATAPILLALYVAAAERRASPARRSVAPSRTTSSRSTSRAGPTSTRPGLDAARHRHLRVLRQRAARAGTRSRSAATTCARPARRPRRSWPSRSPTRSPTVEAALDARASTSTSSRLACRSSSRPGASCSRRSRSSVRPAGCGRESCSERFGAPEHPFDDVPLPRPDCRLARSRRSPSTTTWCGRRSRRSPPCSAAPRASTRTRATRRWPCRRRRPPASRCGPSRSSPTNRASPRRPIRSPARTSSRASRTSSRRRPGSISTRSMPWVGRSRPSRRASSSARSRRPPTGPSGRSSAGDRVVVGMNRFLDEAARHRRLQRIDPEAERRQVEGLRRVRAERDPAPGRLPWPPRRRGAGGRERACPPIIDAVKAYATVGRDQRPAARGMGRAPRARHSLRVGEREAPVESNEADPLSRSGAAPTARAHPSRGRRRPRHDGVARLLP